MIWLPLWFFQEYFQPRCFYATHKKYDIQRISRLKSFRTWSQEWPTSRSKERIIHGWCLKFVVGKWERFFWKKEKSMDVLAWNDRVDRPKAKTLSFFPAESQPRKQTKAFPWNICRGSRRRSLARHANARPYVYAKVLSKRRLSHRPFPEDIGIYSIILIRGSYRRFCFLAAQWPDSLHATVRVFPETGVGRWKERVAGARDRDGESAATRERRGRRQEGASAPRDT